MTFVCSLPVIIGSGLDPEQVPALLAVADGAIIGQWLKRDGLWWNPVDPARVARLMTAVSKLRSEVRP
jgi:predicted TIM-barrel enzyme